MARISVADRRTQLVQAAMQVIAREGMAAATTRAIVAESGMSLASFHYVFQSRDELMKLAVHEVLRVERERILEKLSQITEADGHDLHKLLEAALLGYLHSVQENSAQEQAMLEFTLYSMRNESYLPMALDQYDAYYELVIFLMAQIAEAARIEWTVPSEDLARYMVSVTDGVTLLWLTSRDDEKCARAITLAASGLAVHTRPRAAE